MKQDLTKIVSKHTERTYYATYTHHLEHQHFKMRERIHKVVNMKIRIEISERNSEDEVIIRCHEITNQIQRIQDFIREQTSRMPSLTFYKGNQTYYFPLQDILFFETNSEMVYAHTKKEVFRIKLRLYELEEILPHPFIRVSKSTIVNISHVFTVNHNLTSSSLIEFQNSHKQVYASRRYYKSFMQRLNERSNYENE